MKVVEKGHVYDLANIDVGAGQVGPIAPANRLVFVNREKDKEHAGTQVQEVLRALIDRVKHCDACLSWPGNQDIIQHLRMALVLHEARALGRKTEKGLLVPEFITVDADGHFALTPIPPASASIAAQAQAKLDGEWTAAMQGVDPKGHAFKTLQTGTNIYCAICGAPRGSHA